jgi:hypothetical protein
MNSIFIDNPENVNDYKERFFKVMSFVEKTFPWGFRKTPKGTASPRARFESIAIGSFLALEKIPDLSDKVINVESWHNCNEYKNVVGADGANAKKRLLGRINYVRDKLIEAYNSTEN